MSVQERNHNLEIVLTNSVKMKYEKFGFEDCLPFGVTVDSEKIRVILDTEDPYLGDKLFQFVEDVCKSLNEALEVKGVVEYFANICIMNWPLID